MKRGRIRSPLFGMAAIGAILLFWFLGTPLAHFWGTERQAVWLLVPLSYVLSVIALFKNERYPTIPIAAMVLATLATLMYISVYLVAVMSG